jgi:hypothetical protein
VERRASPLSLSFEGVPLPLHRDRLAVLPASSGLGHAGQANTFRLVR